MNTGMIDALNSDGTCRTGEPHTLKVRMRSVSLRALKAWSNRNYAGSEDSNLSTNPTKTVDLLGGSAMRTIRSEESSSVYFIGQIGLPLGRFFFAEPCVILEGHP